MMMVSFALLYLVAIRIIFKEKWMEAKAGILKKISDIR
jgi:hypothetical protein